MKISDDTLSKIHDISIVTVADKLGMKLYGTGNEGRRACCPYHEDQHPSLHFSTKRGCFKCFVCGAKGDAIKLVQDHENLSFTEACEWIIKECNIIVLPDAPASKSVSSVCDSPGFPKAVPSSIIPLPSDLVKKSLSTQSEFCRALVSNGYLTPLQMQHAAARYRLGATKTEPSFSGRSTNKTTVVMVSLCTISLTVIATNPAILPGQPPNSKSQVNSPKILKTLTASSANIF